MGAVITCLGMLRPCLVVALAVGVVPLPACYQAGSAAPCAVTCDVTSTCPAGQSCNVDGLCSNGGASCSGGAIHRLSLGVSGPGVVQVDGNATCDARGGDRTCVFDVADGALVELIAQPAAGNPVLAWTAPCGGTLPGCTLTVGADTMVGVAFGPAGNRVVNLTLTGGEQGSAIVESDPSGLACPPACVSSFPPTRPIVLRPQLTNDQRWREEPASWNGCTPNGDGTCTVGPGDAGQVAYKFVRTPQLALVVAISNDPTVAYTISRGAPLPWDCTQASLCVDHFDAGTRTTFTVGAGQQVRLDRWSCAGVVCMTDGDRVTIELGTEDATVTAELTRMVDVRVVTGPSSMVAGPVELTLPSNMTRTAFFPAGSSVMIEGNTLANIAPPTACMGWAQAPNDTEFQCTTMPLLTSVVLTLP